MKQMLTYGAALSVLLVPAFALAQFGDINTFFDGVLKLIQSVIIPLLLGVAFLVFIWGIVTYFLVAGEEDDGRKKGRALMLWGIIGFTVIVSIWGIVGLISGGLGFEDSTLDVVPDVPGF